MEEKILGGVNIEKLDEKINEYNEVIREIKEMKDKWDNEKQKFVMNVLKAIKERIEQFDIGRKIYVEKDNMGVTFRLGNYPVEKHLIQYGSQLKYLPLMSGKIEIFVLSPKVRNKEEDTEIKTREFFSIDVCKPDEIIEDKIINHVIEFFDKMIKLEKEELE